MKTENVLVLQCGGLRGANTAGALQALTEAGISPDHFDVCIGNSVGAPNGAFWLAGQNEQMRSLWSNVLPTKDFWNPWRLPLGRAMDLDFLEREVLSHLNSDQLDDVRCRLIVGLTNLDDGGATYAMANRDNVIGLLRATCALPFVTNTVELDIEGNPRRYFDGGVRELLPIQKAFENGSRILVISTRPADWRFTGQPAFLRGALRVSPYRHALDSAFNARARLYNEALRRCTRDNWPVGKQVMLFHPDEEVEGGRLHTDPAITVRNFERGHDMVTRRIGEIKEFLHING